MQRIGFKPFICVALITLVFQEIPAISLRENLKATQIEDRLKAGQIHREKRQHSDACDNAQIDLYEHQNGDDCMNIFYNTPDPFFNENLNTEEFVDKYCGVWKCGDWVPPLMNKITEACVASGLNLTFEADLLSRACKKDSRDYCLYKWAYMDEIFHGNNGSIASIDYNRCLNRNITENPCPTQCKTALTTISDSVGCCYGELLTLNTQIGGLLTNNFFTDCDLPIDRPCSASKKRR